MRGLLTVMAAVLMVGMERDEAFCAEWTRVSPDVAHFKVDQETKAVRSKALGMGKSYAVYTDARTGCVVTTDAP